MNNQDKSLIEKAIDLKGKKYILVSDRVIYFNDTFVNGSITTELISDPKDDVITIKATAIPDCDNPTRKFTSYAQEVIGTTFINKTSAMENCDTSAVGRALAMMGIGVIDSIASVDEINKAQNREVLNKELGTCAACGSSMKISKSGKPYCSALCWKKPVQQKVDTTDTSVPIDSWDTGYQGKR